jgi:Flp pilus assembly protein TadG
MNRFVRAFKTFTRDQRGSAGIIFGLTAIPLLAAAGAGMDFGRYAAAKTHLQASLDAAALASAAPGLSTDAQREAAGDAMFVANMAEGYAAKLPHTGGVKIVNGKAVAEGTVEVDMHFISFAGPKEMTAVGGAEVSLGENKKAEIALVLDYSGSMGETIDGGIKYEIMKEAATKLVDDLEAAAADKVKFALVPFSHHVYTTLPGNQVLGAPPSTPWTGCTQDRKYPHNRTAATPVAGVNPTMWGQPQAPVHISRGCQGYIDNNLMTVELTDDFDVVTDQLDIMEPYAWTHIAVGVEFGYHMLTPNAPYTTAAAMNDSSTEKFLVVLTDGMQTEPGFGSGTSRNVTQGENNLSALCENAKADGITVITMAFDLDDTTTRQRLKNCSSEPDKHFFVANSADDLSGAFEAVKAAVTAQVYLSK